MTRLNRWICQLLACVVVAAVAHPASAGLLPTQVTVTPDSSTYRWTYAIVLPTDSQIRAGDYFTIYDFAGFIPGTNSQPTNWVFSSQNVGPTPPNLLPVESSSLPNLSWMYTGPTVTTGQVGLGNFWAESLYGQSVQSYFTASTQRTSDGNEDQNITTTTVPVPSATPSVPEPATLALVGFGLPLALMMRRRMKTGKIARPTCG